MAHASHEVVIDRPIDEVFAFLADGLNDPQWREGILEIERLTEFADFGAMYKQTVRGPGSSRVRSDYYISAYEPPRLLGFEVTAGPVRPSGRFELTADGPTRTTVRSTLDLAESPGMRLLSGMITREFDREVRQIERLKQALER
ncbi:MAG TPA: SRPBCC family protein [Micromonosporaceae bacterium]